MSVLDPLIACAGKWVGTSQLRESSSSPPDLSDSTATIVSLLGGRFARLDYTWGYRQKPQEGSLLIGYEKSSVEVTAHWIDTWHMGDKVLACRGSAEPDGTISVRGTYAAPPGPDWGWRTVIIPGKQALRLVMYNVTPEDQEELSVEAEYARRS